MKYYTIAPHPVLRPYIRFFWVLEEDHIPAQTPYVHRTMADGSCELIFHYAGVFSGLSEKDNIDPSLHSLLGGPSRTFSRFMTNEAFGIFGVYLYPYATQPLFGVPASALADQQVDVTYLLGQDGKDLEEQMMSATDNHERYIILSGFLEKRVRRLRKQPPPVFAAIHEIIRTKGITTIDTLARDHFLSVRQFERNFKEFAGFSPKLYARIIRFQSAIGKYNNKQIRLTDIAYECGYYDQSHFIHDFKEFSGYHPKVYFAGNNEGTQWKD